jgi:tRNA G10  N-methylase Trm11
MDENMRLVVCNRDPRDEIIAAECETLTGKKPVDGIAAGGSIERVCQAAYLRAGVRTIATGENLESLCDAIREGPFDVDDFRIKTLDFAKRIHKPKHEVIVALADAMPNGRPKLDHPRHRLLLLSHATGFTFGEIVAEPDRSYRRHDSKPYRTSSALPSRLARSLVNLVAPSAQTVLDPCCGSGSILLEAQAIGLRAYGGDWKTALVGMSRKNAAHFGYDIKVEQVDARTSTQPVDAIVTNLPYGKGLETSEEVIRGILQQARILAPVAVFVAYCDISNWLRDAGYEKIELFLVPKYAGFTRYVYRAWR